MLKRRYADVILNQVRAIVHDVLQRYGSEIPEDHTDDSTLRLDSIEVIHIIAKLERDFQVELDDRLLVQGQLNTIRALAEAVEAAQKARLITS
jgi:acyl carrier protein